MKVLYIHQYFVTPDEHGANRSYWFARKLLEKGHQVTLITSTNAFKHPNAGRINVEGIDVIYVKNEYSQYFSKLRKLKSFWMFMVNSIRVASKEKDVDIVFATSTPLTVGIVALYLRLLKGWNYVFEVRDLWPEFPIQVGAIRNKLIIYLLRAFEKFVYKKSEYIITLSPGMRDGVLKCGISDKKICVIPNMSKPDLFYPRELSIDIIEQFGIQCDNFNVIHFGSMGIANGLEYIIETAKALQERDEMSVNFLILGDGSTLPVLQSKVRELELKNVFFLGQYDSFITSEIVNCCDVSLTCFKNIPILYTNSPNKLFDSLSAGKPIIVNSAGWTKDLVEKYNCGFYVDPDDPSDFANKLLWYKNQKKQLDEWGRNARELSLKMFDKSVLSDKFVETLQKVFKTIHSHVS